MVRRSKKCPKCKKRFAAHGNVRRHQDKVNACGAQFVKQRKEVAKRKKSCRNRYDYLNRVGRLHEYQGPPPPFIETTPTTQPPRRVHKNRALTGPEPVQKGWKTPDNPMLERITFVVIDVKLKKLQVWISADIAKRGRLDFHENVVTEIFQFGSVEPAQLVPCEDRQQHLHCPGKTAVE
ncbi:hypothetical protein F442_21121 [Phytophthora nicotianae P10297]|uniref:Uncharacterized protein n=4 Tax=Phytophthora nicotianae TaxID=4792 RepID=W2PF94_PHYN3|nr:hypothetical protein PPTG_18481 [Phytophthora nicotianae INRA-310]ETI31806.1 hypothetical protein F443_21284 [Phytophthora nicotianae P1569]ETM99717.1 hypothetical protein PPTG_18481 [Phytophthora nicotianae INRA-310]ETP29762.1 hypothetical protein F442_21121 [Phytophthora nicotianae P10297]